MQHPVDKPWTRLYPPGVPGAVTVDVLSIVDAWEQRLEREPRAEALAYFDGHLTVTEVDDHANAIACMLRARGISAGDRVGIQLQNIPQFVIVLLALWKLGAVGVLVNPMYHTRELRHLVNDSGAKGLIVDATLYDQAVRALGQDGVEWILTTNSRAFQTRNDKRVFSDVEQAAVSPDGDLLDEAAAFMGVRPPQLTMHPDDVALLTYTSGTTGTPKGAMNTHGNILVVAKTTALWMGITPGDRVLAVAPLFHITGAIIDTVTPLLHDAVVVFINRTKADLVVEAFRDQRVTCTTGSITVFNAILQVNEASSRDFASVKTLYSGGAPIPPATVETFAKRFGHYIHNIFGMTETTSAVIATPPGTKAPVDPATGSLSVGLPLPNLEARVLDPGGLPLSIGQVGELELSGPQIVPGYWENPAATAQTMPGGRLRTGDVALIDEDGWVYIVDRLKDQINVSGYKVWPREVEDVLYEHPSVHEAAVVGAPDKYRGETVIAFVTLRAGHACTEAELIEFSKERLAAYKYPRRIQMLTEMPKTETGKIRRRALRDTTVGDPT